MAQNCHKFTFIHTQIITIVMDHEIFWFNDNIREVQLV